MFTCDYYTAFSAINMSVVLVEVRLNFKKNSDGCVLQTLSSFLVIKMFKVISLHVRDSEGGRTKVSK